MVENGQIYGCNDTQVGGNVIGSKYEGKVIANAGKEDRASYWQLLISNEWMKCDISNAIL